MDKTPLEEKIENFGRKEQNLEKLESSLRDLRISKAWGLSISFLSGSFFLLFTCLFNWIEGSVALWQVIISALIFCFLLYDYLETSRSYDENLNLIRRMRIATKQFRNNLTSIKDPKLKSIFNRVVNKNTP